MEELTYRETKIRVDNENGAAITYWSCQKDNEEIALINNQNYNLFEGSLLFPFPNRLAYGSYTFEGKEYQFENNDFGRPNALHGFIHNKPFELVQKQENSVVFRYLYSGELAAYPFPFIFQVEYLLRKNELDIRIEILNTGEHNMPYGFGWHPYFDLKLSDQGSKFKMPKVTIVDVNEHLIPTGADGPYRAFQELTSVYDKNLDNGFRLETIDHRNSCFLFHPGLGTLEIWQDHNFPFIQVFKPDERAMAIEPMTCGINAFNTQQGLKKLSPQETWAFSMGLKFF